MIHFRFTRRQLFAASLFTLTTVAVFSDTDKSSGAPPIHGAEQQSLVELDPLVVTGQVIPTRLSEAIVPAAVVQPEQADRLRGATLASLFAETPGVHDTAFGAGAGRPVIRGFEGPRVRILENSLDVQDVSATSPDHAVTVEPFFVESVELVRGPATLLYGSSAIGGVVNVEPRYLPTEPPSPGLSLESELRAHSVSDGWEALALATASEEHWAFTIGGLHRETGNYAIPPYALHASKETDHEHQDPHHGDDEEDDERHDHDTNGDEDHHQDNEVLDNSFVDTQNLVIGASWFASADLRLSATFNRLESQYGVPGHEHGEHAEDDPADQHEAEEHVSEHGDADHGAVTIDLVQSRGGFEVASTRELGALAAQSLRFNYSDYTHVEIEGDEVGTRFAQEAYELRGEVQHREWHAITGIWGFQWLHSDFLAEGEEAFTPASETQDLALFALESWRLQHWQIEGGARAEHREVTTGSDSRYGAWAYSVSAGAVYLGGSGWNAGLSLNASERHPTASELYAFGPHAATRQFEVGNPALEQETAYGIDLTFRKLSGPVTGELTLFAVDFEDHIAGLPQGADEDGLQVFEYTPVDARFYGAEARMRVHWIDNAPTHLHLDLFGDIVYGENETLDEPLPRMSPARVGARIEYRNAELVLGASAIHALKQDRTASHETVTGSYTDLSVDAQMLLPFPHGEWALFLRCSNLLNEVIRYHTSYLKEEALAPARGLTVGLNARF